MAWYTVRDFQRGEGVTVDSVSAEADGKFKILIRTHQAHHFKTLECGNDECLIQLAGSQINYPSKSLVTGVELRVHPSCWLAESELPLIDQVAQGTSPRFQESFAPRTDRSHAATLVTILTGPDLMIRDTCVRTSQYAPLVARQNPWLCVKLQVSANRLMHRVFGLVSWHGRLGSRPPEEGRVRG